MKRMKAALLKQINRAHKKSDKLRLSYGYRHLKTRKLSYDSIYEFEVKLSEEEYSQYRGRRLTFDDISLKDREIAIFYRRDEQLFTSEKLKNGTLKEYYTAMLPETVSDPKLDRLARRINARGSNLVKLINAAFLSKSLIEPVCINGELFFANYGSFDVDTNRLHQVYYYAADQKKTANFFSEPQIEVIRYNVIDKKVDKIYQELVLKDDFSEVEWLYYDPEDLHKPVAFLKTINFSKSSK